MSFTRKDSRDLDHSDFRVRTKATQQLEEVLEQVLPALEKALPDSKTLEMRMRIQRLLDKGQNPHADPRVLRELRALEALEKIGTADARQVIRALAAGAAAARLTVAAQECLQRLEAR